MFEFSFLKQTPLYWKKKRQQKNLIVKYGPRYFPLYEIYNMKGKHIIFLYMKIKASINHF